MPGRRCGPRWWPGLISSTHGYSAGMTAASTANTHHSKSIEPVPNTCQAGSTAPRRVAPAPGQKMYESYTLVELSKGAATE